MELRFELGTAGLERVETATSLVVVFCLVGGDDKLVFLLNDKLSRLIIRWS